MPAPGPRASWPARCSLAGAAGCRECRGSRARTSTSLGPTNSTTATGSGSQVGPAPHCVPPRRAACVRVCVCACVRACVRPRALVRLVVSACEALVVSACVRLARTDYERCLHLPRLLPPLRAEHDRRGPWFYEVTPADRAKLREVNIDANPLDALPLREMAEAIDDPFDDEQPQVCSQTRHPGAGAGAWRLRSFPGPLVLCPAATPQPQRWCRAERFCTLAEQLFRGRQPGGGCGSGGACGRRGRRPARGGGAGARTRRMRNSQRPGGLGQCLNSQENGTLDVLLRRTPGFRRHGSHASEGRGIRESAWHLGRGILKRA